MFARVSTYEIPVDRMDEATETFRQAINRIRELAGLVGAHLLVSAESGRLLTMTLWETRAAMEASRVAASRLRSDAVRPFDGSVVSTEEYEVAAQA